MKFLIILVVLFAIPYKSLQAQGLESYEPPALFSPSMSVSPNTTSDNEPSNPPLKRPAVKTEAPKKKSPKKKDILIKGKTVIEPKDKVEPKPVAVDEKNINKITGSNSTKPSQSIVKPKVKPDVLEKPSTIKNLSSSKKAVPPAVKLQPESVEVKKFEAPKASKGIVKGPKTMPAVKKSAVEAEVLFDDNENQKQESSTAVAPKVADSIPAQQSIKSENKPVKREVNTAFLPKFSDAGVLTLLFNKEQESLQSLQTDTLDGVIIPELEAKPSKRMMIKAYAALQDGKLNSDRKMALSRALAIRKHLIEAQIAPERIDIRSLGAKSDIQPIDRVEISLGQ